MPENTAVVLAPLPAAGARSGMAGASAPNTTSMIRWQVCARAATGAGKTALSSEPRGAEISTQSITAWLFGTSGSSSALSV